MMTTLPNCPECGSEYTYEDGILMICPECAHEWTTNNQSDADTKPITRDAHGTELQDGDDVTVIKDLKVKSSSLVVKQGTKVKDIRIIEGDHDIDCRVPKIGQMQLKSEFLKKL